MILTEKRYYYDGTNYVIIEVITRGTKYYRIFFCNTRKRLSGRCMKMLYEQYSKLFQTSSQTSPTLYSPAGRAYFYSEKIRSVIYTKNGGFYYGISSSTS